MARIDRPQFALTVPGDWDEIEAPQGYAFAPQGGGAELYVVPGTVSGEAPDDLIDRFIARRREVLLEEAPGAQVDPVYAERVGDDPVRWFAAENEDGHACFVGVRIAAPFLYAVSLYEDGSGAFDPGDVVPIGLGALRSLDPSAARQAAATLDAVADRPVDVDQLLPLATSTGYALAEDVEVFDLGNGVVLALVEDLDGACRYLTGEDVRAVNLTLVDAWRHAIGNLERRAQQGEIPFVMLDPPDTGVRLLVSTGHWLSASAMVLPNLHAFAEQNLGATPILARIPHRQALVVCADTPHADAVAARFVAEHEAVGDKPLTMARFRLSADGLEALPLDEA